MDIYSKIIGSPVGDLLLFASDRGLAAVLWGADDQGRVKVKATRPGVDHPVLVETERQLAEYFAGVRTRFSIPTEFVGTPFQTAVWRALLTIPYGETRSYRQIAGQIGCPKASRAVGAANGRNPISIIVPCHRVVGGDGKLTGFVGGLEVKARLLELEAWGVMACARSWA
jgi:methylated-DNA-[protein]-cysteine S-methyltransferase